MAKSANEVMQEIVFAALVDGLAALKAAAKGVPNTMLRDINALHPNTTFADLPKELQAAIGESVRTSFTKLLREGYAVGPSRPEPAQRPRLPQGERVDRGVTRRGPPPSGPRPPRPGSERPRGDGPRPPRGPRKP